MHREIGCHFDDGCDDAKDQEGHDDESSQDESGPSQGESSASAHEETDTSLEHHAISRPIRLTLYQSIRLVQSSEHDDFSTLSG